MDGLINILKTNAKTSEVINLDDNIYLYHGIYILNYEDSSPIISILDNGILTLREQFNNGILSLDKIKNNGSFQDKKKRVLNFFKTQKAKDEEVLSAEKNNIVFFSSNKNLFNRVFDISFVVKKDSSFEYRDTNLYNEKQAANMSGEHDWNEYIKHGSVSPNDIIGIKINLDKLLDPKELDKRGSTLEKAIPNIIRMVNDIYDELEKNNLKIPIFNNDDNKILNKSCFRELGELLNQQNKRTKNNTMEIE